MIFAPHILQVKVITPMDKDEFGRPIPGTGGEYWQKVCKCRCDDNTTKEFSSDNGSVYRPNYHVVCEKRITVKAGGKSSVSCPLKPSDSAPLKHSTMPP